MSKNISYYTYGSSNVELSVNDDGLFIKTPDWQLSSGIPGIILTDDATSAPRPIHPSSFEISNMQKSSFAGPGIEYTFGWNSQEGLDISWHITAHERLPIVLLGATVKNTSEQQLRLAEMGLLSSKNSYLNCQGNPYDWMLSTVGASKRSGNLAEKMLSNNEQIIRLWKGFNMPIPTPLSQRPFDTDGDWRCFKDYVTLYKDSGNIGFTVAATGSPRAWTSFRCHTGNPEQLQFEATAEMSDIILEPGQSRNAQEIALVILPYHEALPLIMRWQAATHGCRTARKTPSGWCSWYSVGPDVDAETVLKVTKTFKKEEQRIKPDFIQIDDGFQQTVGNWKCNEKFQVGWKPVISTIQQTGALPGIWLAPLAVHKNTAIFHSHPDWFQRSADGSLARQASNWGPTSYWLDPSHPEVKKFLRELLIEFKELGFKYFKIDFNTIDDKTRFYDSSKTSLEVYRELYQLYREVVGEDSYLLACAGFNRGVFGYADAVRTGPDSCSHWKAAHDCTISRCLETVGSSTHANRILFTCDPDVTYLRSTGSLSEDEWRTWHNYVGTLGGLTAISDLIDKPESHENLRMLEILMPPAPETGLSLNGGTDIKHRWLGYLSQRSWGKAAVVTGYNPADTSCSMKLGIKKTGLPESTSYLIWSFWNETVEIVNNSLIHFEEVAPHASNLVRITPIPQEVTEPFLAGSNLHISCGSAEIADFCFTTNTIQLKLTDAGARSGALFIYCSDRLTLGETVGLEARKPCPVSQNIYRLEITNRQYGEKQSINLLCSK